MWWNRCVQPNPRPLLNRTDLPQSALADRIRLNLLPFFSHRELSAWTTICFRTSGAHDAIKGSTRKYPDSPYLVVGPCSTAFSTRARYRIGHSTSDSCSSPANWSGPQRRECAGPGRNRRAPVDGRGTHPRRSHRWYQHGQHHWRNVCHRHVTGRDPEVCRRDRLGPSLSSRARLYPDLLPQETRSARLPDQGSPWAEAWAPRA